MKITVAVVALLCAIALAPRADASREKNQAREQRDVVRNMRVAYPQLQAGARSLGDFIAAGGDPAQIQAHLDAARQGLAAYPHVWRFLVTQGGQADAVAAAHLDTLIAALRLSDAANRAGIPSDLIDRSSVGLLMNYATLPTRPPEPVAVTTLVDGRTAIELRPPGKADINYMNPYYHRALAAEPTFVATFRPGSMEQALVAYMQALDPHYPESTLARRLHELPRVKLDLPEEAIAANLFKVRMILTAP